MKNIKEIFKKIIQIDSVSGEEKLIRDFIIDLLKNKKNYFYKIDKVGNLFIKNNKKNNKPLLFCAHLDTVEPGRKIKPQIKNDYFISDGQTILGADNKAFVAVLIDILVNEKIDRNIEIVFSVREETGGGIEFFPFKWLKSNKGIIFDNANPIGGIVLRSPRIINFYINFFGKSSHASLPKNGINSLIPMIRFIKNLPIGIYKKNTTINIGIINSGSGINTIPEKTVIKGEIRSYNENNFQVIKNQIIKKISLIKKNFSGKIELAFDGYCPGYNFQKKDFFIQEIKQIIIKNKIKPYFLNNSGISDANILNQRGIKTIVLSDGVIDPHTTREKIKVEDLYKLKELTMDFIRNL